MFWFTCVLVLGTNGAYAQKDSTKSNKKTQERIAPPGQVSKQIDTSKAKTNVKRLPAVVEHGDTIPIFSLQDTKISTVTDPETLQKQKDWDRLLRNVNFLMQYANLCANKMKEIDAKTAAMDRRHDRNKYLRTEREALVDNYSKTLKDLSDYQGKLLIKLIYRQTGKTTYDIIKQYESGFTAGFWQTMAKLDAMDLKETYDPNKDVMIETAIKQCGYK